MIPESVQLGSITCHCGSCVVGFRGRAEGASAPNQVGGCCSVRPPITLRTKDAVRAAHILNPSNREPSLRAKDERLSGISPILRGALSLTFQ